MCRQICSFLLSITHQCASNHQLSCGACRMHDTLMFSFRLSTHSMHLISIIIETKKQSTTSHLARNLSRRALGDSSGWRVTKKSLASPAKLAAHKRATWLSRAHNQGMSRFCLRHITSCPTPCPAPSAPQPSRLAPDSSQRSLRVPP